VSKGKISSTNVGISEVVLPIVDPQVDVEARNKPYFVSVVGEEDGPIYYYLDHFFSCVAQAIYPAPTSSGQFVKACTAAFKKRAKAGDLDWRELNTFAKTQSFSDPSSIPSIVNGIFLAIEEEGCHRAHKTRS
jgi:hypothetical protein